jgi:hypothetical protein
MKTLSLITLFTYLFINPIYFNQLEDPFFHPLTIQESNFEFSPPQEQQVSYCSFTVFDGPNKGNYEILFDEESGYCYNDFENSQYVIEIHGSNYIDLMIILENLEIGRHNFSMEMQIAIDMSLNDGEDYFTLDNYYENREGFIEIEKINKGYIYGRFEGLFGDGSVEEDYSMQMEGAFAVRIEEYED